MLILFIVVLIGVIIRLASRSRKPTFSIHFEASFDNKLGKVTLSEPEVLQQYYDGPKPTARQKEENLQRVFKVIEQFPNGVLAQRNPEYVKEYLDRVKLDLPPGIHTEGDSAA